MSGDLDLEQRYRRVLRLLPGYYRDKWCSGHSEASSSPSICPPRIKLSSFTASWSRPADGRCGVSSA